MVTRRLSLVRGHPTVALQPHQLPRRVWPWIAGALVAGIMVGIALHRMRSPDPSRRMRSLLEDDADDPFKRWVQAVFLIVTSDCDYAYLGRTEGRRMLQDWWDIHGPRGFTNTLDELANANRPDNAWDLIRFILVARMGVAAEYWTSDDSWHAIRPIAARLQRAYSDWRPMAQAYLLARRQWRGMPLDGSDDDDEMAVIVDNIARLHDSRWQALPFRVALETADGRG